jgi:hypothetical protein
MSPCIGCGGELIAGEPLASTLVTEYAKEGVRRFTAFRCRDCMEDFACACWDEESRGPYPGTVTRVEGRVS